MTPQPPWSRGPRRRVNISHRRDGTRWVAGRLAASLDAHRLFRDPGDIPAGADSDPVIAGTLDAVTVLTGPRWLGETGQSRSQTSGDGEAQAARAAIDEGVPVDPALVDGTPMPRTAALDFPSANEHRLRGLNPLPSLALRTPGMVFKVLYAPIEKLPASGARSLAPGAGPSRQLMRVDTGLPGLRHWQ